VLLDDLELLREFCATRVCEKLSRPPKALRAVRATLAQLEQTHAACPSRLEATRSNLPASRDRPQLWMQNFRAFFLRWQETAVTSTVRSGAGDHPCARNC
jgi:hypothetical protein